MQPPRPKAHSACSPISASIDRGGSGWRGSGDEGTQIAPAVTVNKVTVAALACHPRISYRLAGASSLDIQENHRWSEPLRLFQLQSYAACCWFRPAPMPRTRAMQML